MWERCSHLKQLFSRGNSMRMIWNGFCSFFYLDLAKIRETWAAHCSIHKLSNRVALSGSVWLADCRTVCFRTVHVCECVMLKSPFHSQYDSMIRNPIWLAAPFQFATVRNDNGDNDDHWQLTVVVVRQNRRKPVGLDFFCTCFIFKQLVACAVYTYRSNIISHFAIENGK